MSDAEVAGLRRLMELLGNPAAAAGLIAELDGILNTNDAASDARLSDGSLGFKFDSPEQARSFLRQFRSLLAGDRG